MKTKKIPNVYLFATKKITISNTAKASVRNICLVPVLKFLHGAGMPIFIRDSV